MEQVVCRISARKKRTRNQTKGRRKVLGSEAFEALYDVYDNVICGKGSL